MLKIKPSVMAFIQEQASKYPEIEKIAIFGSRARGDATERSDYDLAVYARKITDGRWARFSIEFEDEVPSLNSVDLVLVSPDLSSDLRRSIQDEGVTVYAR